jgi:exosome complex component CSL4
MGKIRHLYQGQSKTTKTSPVKVVPGELLSHDQSKAGGSGTYIDSEGCLRASIIGTLVDSDHLPISVNPPEPKCTQLPPVGSTVIGRCVRITQRFAAIDIESIVGDCNNSSTINLVTPLKGTIRLQDIYPVEELETAVVPNCFRPGDLVKARVIGRGEPSAGLLLSTGVDLSLGVIGASNKDGESMQIIAWNQIRDPSTGTIESRKCAKP